MNLFSFFKILLLAIASWILVHLFAIFGFFLAIAYPIWLLTLPEKTSCLWCRTRKSGEWCPLCHKTVDKSDLIPSSFRAVFLNVLLVLVISGISLGVVFTESYVLKTLGFPPTPKTVSIVIPPKGQYRIGEIFPLKIEIAGVKTPVNAIQADLSFEPQKVEAVEISTQESFANIFVQKEIDNEVGFARLTGGLPNPGFIAEKGVFGTVYFKGKAPGATKIEFLPSSKVLANDGRGTNVLKELASASYLILPEEMSEEEKKQQEVLLVPVVLGEKAEETQMKFYEEQKILGEKISQEIQKKKKPAWRNPFGQTLETIDSFILSFWQKLSQLLRR